MKYQLWVCVLGLTLTNEWFSEKKKNDIVFSKEHKDEILDKLMRIFKDKIGLKFTDDMKAKTIKIFDEKCKNSKNEYIPPGYCDKDKFINRYGDYFIWEQIKLYSKEHDLNIIFVTNDAKEDWWKQGRDKTITPRPELLDEFYEFTGNEIYMYNIQDFIKHAQKTSNVKINKETLKEIISIHKKFTTENISNNDLRIKIEKILNEKILHDDFKAYPKQFQYTYINNIVEMINELTMLVDKAVYDNDNYSNLLYRDWINRLQQLKLDLSKITVL